MSVCIVHRDGWAVSDSRSSASRGRICPVTAKKIFKVQDHALVAAVGSAFIGQSADILCSDKPANEIIGALSCHMMESSGEGCLLMVDEDGYLAEICGEGSVEAIDSDMEYWVIGSASELVIGYLECVKAMSGEIDPDDAIAAVKMASRFSADIDDRCQVEFLGEDEDGVVSSEPTKEKSN